MMPMPEMGWQYGHPELLWYMDIGGAVFAVAIGIGVGLFLWMDR